MQKEKTLERSNKVEVRIRYKPDEFDLADSLKDNLEMDAEVQDLEIFVEMEEI